MNAPRSPLLTTLQTSTPGLEGWVFGRFPRRIAMLQKFLLTMQVKSFGSYQPVEIGGRQLRPGDRECADRWRTIEAAVAAEQIDSVLDLGCAEGFFIRQAATKWNAIALGVDADVRRVTVAQSLTVQQGIAGAG